MLNPGVVVAEKYRIERVLGRGAMGVVVEAMHVQLQQRVALKFLLAKLADEAAIVERFVREARASAQLRGEHVCRVSDVGRGDDGVPYIVMELLEGGDLATLVDTNGPLPVEAATEYVLQACVGVAEAHALGIVHRDLKPANLFLTERPDGTLLIKVLDFGIAKAEASEAFSLTQTSALLGSPAYMSPEQLRSSRAADARSDIWAIGVILYELVAGRPPFTGETITDLALHITLDPAPVLEGASPEFGAIVNRCLAKDPADRYADLASLAEALAPFGGPGAAEYVPMIARLLGRRMTRSSPVMEAATPAAEPEPVPAPAPPATAASSSRMTTFGGTAGAIVTDDAQAPRRRNWRIIGGVAGAIIVVAGIALFAIPRSSAPPRDAPAGAPQPIITPLPAAAPTPPPVVEPPVVEPPTPPPPIDPSIATGSAGSAAAPPATPKASKPTKRPKPREDLGDSRY